jgi:hypothetical protein
MDARLVCGALRHRSGSTCGPAGPARPVSGRHFRWSGNSSWPNGANQTRFAKWRFRPKPATAVCKKVTVLATVAWVAILIPQRKRYQHVEIDEFVRIRTIP